MEGVGSESAKFWKPPCGVESDEDCSCGIVFIYAGDSASGARGIGDG